MFAIRQASPQQTVNLARKESKANGVPVRLSRFETGFLLVKTSAPADQGHPRQMIIS
jgi:hypothetical protein